MLNKKYLLVIVAFLFLTGCAGFGTRDRGERLSHADQRKIHLKQCVKEFLHEDVHPKMSQEICQSIYERWRGRK